MDFGPGQLHVMKLDFKSQPSSKSTLLLAGLQHMQQCQVGWNITLYLFATGYWSKWMASSAGVLNPRSFSHESFTLTTRPRLLANKWLFVTSSFWLFSIICLKMSYAWVPKTNQVRVDWLRLSILYLGFNLYYFSYFASYEFWLCFFYFNSTRLGKYYYTSQVIMFFIIIISYLGSEKWLEKADISTFFKRSCFVSSFGCERCWS